MISEFLKSILFRSNKKNILILGNGQLGTELKIFLNKYLENSLVNVLDRNILDIDEKISYLKLKNILDKFIQNTKKYDVIVNCIAYTNTVKAEAKDGGYLDSFYVNASFPKYLAMYCKENAIKLIHISTDYVQSEFGDEIPVNVYGTTKLIGEKNIQTILNKKDFLILRTSWLYSLKHKQNFVFKFIKNCINASKNIDLFGNAEINIVENQISMPTHVETVCKQIFYGITNKKYHGIKNCTDKSITNSGISRYEFANHILQCCKHATENTQYEKIFKNIKLQRIKMRSFYDNTTSMKYPENSTLKNKNKKVLEVESWSYILSKEIFKNLMNVLKN